MYGERHYHVCNIMTFVQVEQLINVASMILEENACTLKLAYLKILRGRVRCRILQCFLLVEGSMIKDAGRKVARSHRMLLGECKVYSILQQVTLILIFSVCWEVAGKENLWTWQIGIDKIAFCCNQRFSAVFGFSAFLATYLSRSLCMIFASPSKCTRYTSRFCKRRKSKPADIRNIQNVYFVRIKDLRGLLYLFRMLSSRLLQRLLCRMCDEWKVLVVFIFCIWLTRCLSTGLVTRHPVCWELPAPYEDHQWNCSLLFWKNLLT